MDKTKRKVKVRYIIIIIVAILLAAVCAALVWQWDNIKALKYSQSMSEEEIQSELDENQKEFDQVAEEFNIADMNLTQEQIDAVVSGALKVEDVVDTVIGSSEEGSSTSGGGDASQDAEVQRIVASLYVLRSSYSSQLSGLISSAKSEFASLPAEQQTATAKRRIVAAKINQASALESSCDAQVSSLLSSLRARLTELGQDTSLADQIQSSYNQEKTLKKASYLSQLG